MKITARVHNAAGRHVAEVATAGARKVVGIPPKEGAPGSGINGGELLFLAIATCYCNDVYREAGKRGIAIESIEVEVTGEFGGEGEAARDVRYSAKVAGAASEAELEELLVVTDSVAEIHNTLRSGVPVRLDGTEVIRVARAVGP